MKTCKVELLNMEFFAYHGCFKEEQIIGNKFLVSFEASVECESAALNDNIEDALNYQDVYVLIREEMMIPSKIMESVALRILERVKSRYPVIIQATVSISKMNPPIGGKVEASRITMSI